MCGITQQMQQKLTTIKPPKENTLYWNKIQYNRNNKKQCLNTGLKRNASRIHNKKQFLKSNVLKSNVVILGSTNTLTPMHQE